MAGRSRDLDGVTDCDAPAAGDARIESETLIRFADDGAKDAGIVRQIALRQRHHDAASGRDLAAQLDLAEAHAPSAAPARFDETHGAAGELDHRIGAKAPHVPGGL